MPLYFFHLNFGHRVLPDEEGVELPNRSAAREEALAAVRSEGKSIFCGRASYRPSYPRYACR
jgi:hypothetical protein